MWLLENKTKKIIENAESSGIIPTAEQLINFKAIHDDDNSNILYKAGSSAEISIKGILTKTQSFLAILFGEGNTTYSSIVTALENAENDEDIKEIVLHIDSPGGQFDGMFSAIEAIQATSKPVTAIVSGLATSAAFALASQADEIVAINRAVRVGSIGVVASIKVLDDEVTITSTDAPNKAPNVTTKEGIAVVQDQLDDLHAIFVEAIASGRDTTVKDVNANFGRGGVLLASEALKRGMIDKIAGPSLQLIGNADNTKAINSNNQSETIDMDLNKLKAEHKSIYDQAVQNGVDEERDRVIGHLIMGEQSGGMQIAVDAIKSGKGFTCEIHALYQGAGLSKRDVQARDADEVEASKAVDNAALNETDEKEKQADLVADLVASKFRIK